MGAPIKRPNATGVSFRIKTDNYLVLKSHCADSGISLADAIDKLVEDTLINTVKQVDKLPITTKRRLTDYCEASGFTAAQVIEQLLTDHLPD
jgi:hypothetical protein